MAATGQLWHAWDDLKGGRISRRAFIERATALGVGMPIMLACLNALGMKGATAFAAQTDPPAGRPMSGTVGQQRGAGGELKVLMWQAPTLLSPHTGNSGKDYLPTQFVTEPLMNYLADASLTPTLIQEIPSVANGLLSEDLTTVTFKLLPEVTWSDGEPLTANDVVFTWQWIMNLANQAIDVAIYQPIETIEAVDDLTARVTFAAPTLGWFIPFSANWGGVYPGHLWDFDPAKPGVIDAFQQQPVGTGPFVVDSFTENDQVIYVANERYREPNKPFFARVNLKGGGDATAAARAVLETGDWDFAWNLQVEPAVLRDVEDGGKGTVVVIPGANQEQILFNLSDPNRDVDGQKSHKGTPHPFLADPAVRQAMSLAVDRAAIATQFYDGPPGEPPAGNVIVGIPAYESPNTAWAFDLAQAGQLLDEAGWVMDGDVRTKDGIKLEVVYTTSINPVRQKTQAVVKQGLEELGVKVQLKQLDSGVFFDVSPGNEQTYTHFYMDLQMFTNGTSSPLPFDYMRWWYAGPEGRNIPQKENDWAGQNVSRHQNREFDALYEEALATTDPEQLADLFIQMNDILVNEAIVLPIVQRAAEKYAISTRLNNDNVGMGTFEGDFWNVANWNLAE
ncbi:MAG: peptide ABC transporter substrate-binding protein [Thermomicrobiales bacterium]